MNMPTGDPNPLRPPSSRVADAEASTSARLLAEPRQVEPGSPLQWVSTAWNMFKEAPGPWVGMALVYILVLIVLGAIPVIGIVNNILSPIFAAGLMLAAEGQKNGQRPAVGQVFAGFKRNAGMLALLGVLYMCAIFAIALIAGVGILGAAGAMMAGGRDASPIGIAGAIVFGLLFVVLMLPLSFAMMWAPALIAIHDVQPFPALTLALTACVRNWAPLIVLALFGLLMIVPIVLTLGFGALVVGPVMFIAVWAGYRDVFVR